MLYALKVESMIYTYRQHRKEIDDYIREHYPDDVDKHFEPNNKRFGKNHSGMRRYK